MKNENYLSPRHQVKVSFLFFLRGKKVGNGRKAKRGQFFLLHCAPAHKSWVESYVKSLQAFLTFSSLGAITNGGAISSAAAAAAFEI